MCGGGEAGEASATGLFRPEALEAARSRLGAPVKPVGVAGWVLTAFLLLIFATAGVFVATARYARKETVPGVLSPTEGAVRVAALKPGVVAEVHVKEGARVAAGAPLLTVSTDTTVAEGRSLGALLGAAAEQEAEAVTAQAAAQRAGAGRRREELEARRAGLEEDGARLAADLALQDERLRLAQASAEAARTLFDKQLLPAVQYRQREEAVIAARQARAAIEREMARDRAQLAQVAAEAGRLGAESAELDAQAAVAGARAAEKRAGLEAETGLVLTARRAGRVAALQGRPGAPVQPGATLAVILPEGEGLEADLWVPSRAAGFVKPGDKVRLLYDAFPYQRFGVGRGVVREVSRAPVLPQDLPVPIETKEALYRVTVTLSRQDVAAYGRRWALSPGMRLTADLVLDERPLLAWLLDPVLAIKNRGGSER